MKISFVIPTFNCAAWLHPAVDSCLKQSHKDIEIVIVDDASTDSTKKYLTFLDSQNDKRIKIISLSKNVGRSEARNIGNREASGDVICVLDADDLCYPKRAELTVKAFEKGVKFLYGSAIMMNALGEPIRELTADVFDKEKAENTLQNYIVHSTVAYTKEISTSFPYKSGDFSRLGIDDWMQQTEIFNSGVKLDFVPNVLSAYRVLGTSITSTRNIDDVVKLKKSVISKEEIQAV